MSASTPTSSPAPARPSPAGLASRSTTRPRQTTNTLDLKLVDIVNRVDVDNTSSPLRFLVRINRHLFANQVAGV
jgi:hypothetical protein